MFLDDQDRSDPNLLMFLSCQRTRRSMGKGLIKPKYVFCFNPLFPQVSHRAFQCLSNQHRYRFLPLIALASARLHQDTPSKHYVIKTHGSHYSSCIRPLLFRHTFVTSES